MNIENKTVLVTGSTDGVGRLVARRLADQGARVLIHGRDRTRSEQLLNEIRAAHRGSVSFLPADFSSLAEVRRLADTVRQECDRLDLLTNTAGIGSGGSAGKRETSQDGHELRFAVNYLAGFLLTRVLLPLLMLGKPARIVNVSSLGQHPIDFDDVMLTRGYSGSRAYARWTHTVQGRERVDQGVVRLTPENLTTESQHSAVAACKGGWVAIDLRSTVGLASLPRSGRGRPSPGMLAKACSIASAASRSSRSPRKRPVTCRPKGIACSSIPHGMEITELVTSVTT